MQKPEERASLKDLDARIKAVRQRQEYAAGPAARGKVDAQGWGFGMRLASELVGGIVGGIGFGWLLDYWLDTGPFFLILLFFLGSVAGIVNVYKTATRQGMAVGYQKPAGGPDEKENSFEDRGSGNGS